MNSEQFEGGACQSFINDIHGELEEQVSLMKRPLARRIDCSAVY